MGKAADRAIETGNGFVQFAFANNGSPDFITLKLKCARRLHVIETPQG